MSLQAKNSSAENLITQHLDTWTQAIETKSTAGRGSSNKLNLVGIQKLRELILEMAVRGLLVPQDPNDDPASVLLEKIAAEKVQLIKDGKIKKNKALPEITDDEKPFELPNGWEWASNLTIFELVKGKKPKHLSEKKGIYPYLDIEALDRGNVLRFTDDESAPKCTTDDLLVVCDGSRSGLILEGQNGVIGSTLARVDTSNSLKPFIKLFFQNAYQHLNSNLKGAAIPHLDTKALRSGFMALPSLEEQKRIVSKVDELMALCDQLESQTLDSIATHQTLVETLLGNLVNPDNTANFDQAWSLIAQNFDVLFTTEHSIDTLKQTILQLAVMGKLVPQNPNDEPASELLKKIAAEKAQLIKDGKIKKSKALPPITDAEKPFDLPNGWEWVRLIDVTSKITDGDHKTPKRIEIGEMLLSAKNVRDGFVDFDDVDRISSVDYKKSRERCLPETGDLMMVSVGGTIGRSSLVPEQSNFALVRSVALIKPLKFNSNYLKYLADSPMLQNLIHGNKRGGAQPCLYLSEISKFVFPIPPKEEQTRIVAKVNELMTLCDQIKTQLQTAQTTQCHLAHSITQEILQ
ncbi:restriction endonuclease subunit S [Thiomicrorhabdus cannonii]|uniref:restriction endonuclease subunit S n=1 Tax=Thiomicrorhabdus cannonii TaxID=2748011 RepID=UPI0015C05B47|nr:restriction endonuclease subunit S [Thiomicrorhabdus cannonii]